MSIVRHWPSQASWLGPITSLSASRWTLARLRSVMVQRLPALPYSPTLIEQWFSASTAPLRRAQR